MSAHAFLPPSGADAWEPCAVWPHMNQLFPELEPSVKSLEGDAAHYVLAQHLHGNIMAEGAQTPNGQIVTGEMLDGAQLFVDALGSTTGLQVWVEQRFHGKRVHAEHNWGTPDVATFAWPWLRVYDYKFGHEVHEVYEHRQLINYAALIMDTLGIDGRSDQQLQVELVIVQPRAHHKDGPVRRWLVGPASNLRGHINQLHAAAERAVAPLDQRLAKVGPHCAHCPGRVACQTNNAVAQTAAEVSKGTDLLEMTPHQVGLQLRFLERAAAILNSRITGLQEQAMGLYRRGQAVPFYTMESGQSKKVWTADYGTVKALGEAMQVPLTKPALITPLQAIQAGLTEDMVAQFSTSIPGAAKLKPDDGSKARRAFGTTC